MLNSVHTGVCRYHCAPMGRKKILFFTHKNTRSHYFMRCVWQFNFIGNISPNFSSHPRSAWVADIVDNMHSHAEHGNECKGSCWVMHTQLIIGKKIGYIKQQTATKWQQETKEISAMLGGLINKRKGFSVKGNRYEMPDTRKTSNLLAPRT